MTIKLIKLIAVCRSLAIRTLLAAAFFFAVASSAQAQILWYNGDDDHISGLVGTDSTVTEGADGIVYDDFNIASNTTWDISGVYGTFLYSTVAKGGDDAITPTANWEIRTGVSDGNPGTLVASGVAPLTVTQIGTDRGYTLNTASISGLDVTLGTGTYWLGIQPVATAGYGYLVTTSGTNSIGSPGGNDSNAFYTSTSFGYYFFPTGPPPVQGNDFSMGVTGIAVTPEPSTWLLLVIGGIVLVSFRLRKYAVR